MLCNLLFALPEWPPSERILPKSSVLFKAFSTLLPIILTQCFLVRPLLLSFHVAIIIIINLWRVRAVFGFRPYFHTPWWSLVACHFNLHARQVGALFVVASLLCRLRAYIKFGRFVYSKLLSVPLSFYFFIALCLSTLLNNRCVYLVSSRDILSRPNLPMLHYICYYDISVVTKFRFTWSNFPLTS